MKNDEPDLMIHPEDFHVFLKARLSVSGSVATFAEELGVSTQFLYSLLTGKRKPSASLLKKLGGEVYYGFNSTKAKK